MDKMTDKRFKEVLENEFYLNSDHELVHEIFACRKEIKELKANNEKLKIRQDGDADHIADLQDINATLKLKAEMASLGCATTRELLEEVRCRIELDGNLDYRTVDS